MARESLGTAAAAANDLVRKTEVDAVGTWVNYTPTLVQGVTVNKTVSRARYTQIGKTIIGSVNIACTSTGSASNEVRVGLPVTAAATGAIPIGLGFIYDSSVGLAYKAMAVLDNTGYMTFIATNTTTAGRLGADTFTAALATSDSIEIQFNYEAA